MRTLTKISLLLALLFITGKSMAQVGINATGTAPATAAMLDISSPNKGLLIPRVALTATNTNAPIGASIVTSLLVYNTATAGVVPNNVIPGYYYWNGTAWVALSNSGSGAGAGWSLTGNTGTNPATNFLGTTDNQPIVFKANNLEKMLVQNGPNSTTNLVLKDAGHNVLIGEQVSLNAGVISTVWGPTGSHIFPTNAHNVAIGYEAMRDNTIAGNTVAIGYRALSKTGNNTSNQLTQSLANTAVGDRAMEENLTGSSNTAFGAGALRSNLGSSFNVAVGSASLGSNTLGSTNTAIGHESLEANTEGYLNTGLGHAALNKNSIGSQNVAVGERALFYNRTGNENVAIGYRALEQASSDLDDNPLLAVSRDGIVAVGAHALENNGKNATLIDHSSYNTAIGANSLNANTIGYANTALGFESLKSNTSGIFNTAIGTNALKSNSTTSGNTAIGTYTLAANTDGKENTAIGSDALANIITGSNNTAIGQGAQSFKTEGSNNTSIGSISLQLNQGVDNTAIGSAAGSNNQTGSRNIFLGNGAGFNELGSDKLYIEPSGANQNNALIFGDFAADSLRINGKASVSNNAIIQGFTKLGGYGTNVPSIKMKELTMTTAGGATIATGPSQGIHGLDATKILSVSVLVTVNAAVSTPPGYDADTQLKYNYYVGTTNIVIQNQASGCAVGNFICNKTARVLITYKE